MFAMYENRPAYNAEEMLFDVLDDGNL